MNPGASRFPDPYRKRADVGHATAFLVVLLVIISVAGILFYGNAAIFAPIDTTSLGTSALSIASAAAAPARSTARAVTPVSQPTVTAPTPAPPLAGVPFQPKPSQTATPLGAIPATPTPASSAMTATATPPAVARVGNTGGDGVWLRHTPHLADRWVAWPDRTSLTLLGNEADGDGQHWIQVRDPSGNVGWIPAQYAVR